MFARPAADLSFVQIPNFKSCTAAAIPTGRYATPEEIAGAVLYLCSDLATDVTGTHIVIDGGRSGTGGVAPQRRPQ